MKYPKKPGDNLLSGSFIVSGQCKARLDKVGADSYVSKLTLEAKAQQRGEQSEMIRSLDRLVKIVGILIIPIGILLFSQQFFITGESFRGSVTGTVAAVIGMIPEGLYLLASVAMAVSVMRLAMNKVLVHNMKSIETLARVDVLCVDKTGTITENTMTVKRAVPLRPAAAAEPDKAAEEAAESAEGEHKYVYLFCFRIGDRFRNGESAGEEFTPEELAALELQLGDFVAGMSSDNITMKAMKDYFKKQTGKRPDQVFPFSSAFKYSGAVFGEKSFVLGAPEFLLRSQYESYRQAIERYSTQGYRVLVFGEYQGTLDGKELDGPGAAQRHGAFGQSHPGAGAGNLPVFCGAGSCHQGDFRDNPVTVSEVAKEAGIENAHLYVDASSLHTIDEVLEAVDRYTVFGRVTPEQKRMFVGALKQKGHTVAMTGDGVNDVLALKDADCSVAMASGSDAAAHAAQIVLLESDFAKMPSVVAEGRRVVNNIERTASLFLVKEYFLPADVRVLHCVYDELPSGTLPDFADQYVYHRRAGVYHVPGAEPEPDTGTFS